ncbi:MAG: RCC1 domain-containing protein [Planctomycetota bacterium]
MAAGDRHSLALQADGQVQAWGNNSSGQCDVPALPAGLSYVEVAAGGAVFFDFSGIPAFGYPSQAHSLARRSDGSIVAWGSNSYGQCNVPVLPPGLTYTAIAAGPAHSLALRSDGSVVAWGNAAAGALDVPPLPAGLTYVEVSAGGWSSQLKLVSWSSTFCPQFTVSFAHGRSAALRSDGSIVAWGYWLDVPSLPAGLTYVEVSAGSKHMAARRSDGSVVAWGANEAGQCDVPALPPGLTYAGVAAGVETTTAWLSDGSLVEWGSPLASGSGYPLSAPPLPPGVGYVGLAAGGAFADYDEQTSVYDDSSQACIVVGSEHHQYTGAHVVALRSDGSVVAWGDDSSGQCDVPPAPEAWTDLVGGLAGVNGIPDLAGTGPLTAGSAGTLDLANAAPSAPTVLFLSLSSTPTDFKCGVLVPVPVVAQLLLSTDASGNLPLAWTSWPPGLSGASMYLQYAITDGAAVCGASLSNALRADVP